MDTITFICLLASAAALGYIVGVWVGFDSGYKAAWDRATGWNPK
jgi:hypothetical protein